MDIMERRSSRNKNVVLHHSSISTGRKTSQKIEDKKRKYVGTQASTKQSMKRAKTKSLESVEGDIDQKIIEFVDQKMDALLKEFENDIETSMGLLKMKFAQCVTEETPDRNVVVENPESSEGRMRKRVGKKLVITLQNINQDNVPWVRNMGGSYIQRSNTSGELPKPLDSVLVERRVTASEDMGIRDFFQKNKELGDREFPEKVHGVQMHIRDVLSLSPRGWLTGEVLSVYGMIIKQMTASASGKPSVHIEDNYFMNFLLNYYKEYYTTKERHYAAIVRKRLSSANLGYNPADMLILIPMNHGNKHWTLAVVDPIDATIYMLDSMYTRDELQKNYKKQIKVMQTMLPIALWGITESGYAGVEKNWNVFCVDDIPRQKNTFDCGVFVIAYMDLIARGRPVNFNPNLGDTKRVICRDILVAVGAL